MDLQTILVVILFVAALFYIGRMIYRAATPKKGGCGSSCKCSADFSNIESQKK